MVTTKGWKKPGVVRGPDREMSLTSGGHVVQI